MKNTRDVRLDFIRGISIIIVVCAHAMQINLKQGASNAFWMYIRTFQMPLLFFISGYTAGFSYPCNDSKKYIMQKTARLFVPYIVWAEIFYAICCITGYEKLSIKSAILCLADSPFWFLRHLMIYFIAICISNIVLNFTIHKLKSNTLTTVFSLGLPCIGGALVFGLRNTVFLNQASAVWHYLWFLGGYALFVLLEKRQGIKKCLWNNGMLIISAGMMIAIFLLYEYVHTNEYIICTLSVASICLFLGNLSGKCRARVGALVIKLGNNTLPIYAIHWCILFAPNLYVNWYVKLLDSNYYLLNVLMTAIAWMLICMIMIRLLRRNKVTRKVLMGER